jgi:phosphoribosylformylglycinamidine synthase
VRVEDRDVDERKLREVALTAEEYRVIVEALKRPPNDVELGMLGVLWSEHCSYKTSKPLLRPCCRAQARTPAR